MPAKMKLSSWLKSGGTSQSAWLRRLGWIRVAAVTVLLVIILLVRLLHHA